MHLGSRFFASSLAGLSLLALLLTVSGCATPPEDPEARAAFAEINDPLEPTNRKFFAFNRAVDRAALKPLARAYKAALPQTVRLGVRNFIRNVRTPIILVNDLLQGEGNRAGITLSRFITNTLAGFGGIADVAGDSGAPFHDEDFGQTLAVWGAGEGAYLMVPLLGPSNPRDLTGFIVDIAFDPLTYVTAFSDSIDDEITYAGIGMNFTDQVDARSRNIEALDEIERTSLDFYATVRSLYRQRRDDEIRNGVPTEGYPGPTLLSGDDESAPPSAASAPR